ncbi:hypothetical protein ACWCW7_18680 [Nocardia tengchongensis]
MSDASELKDDELDARVAAYAAVADVDNTTRTYTRAWSRFAGWRETAGHTVLPVSTRVINRYLVAAAEDPGKPFGSATLGNGRNRFRSGSNAVLCCFLFADQLRSFGLSACRHAERPARRAAAARRAHGCSAVL